jgi:hypothetical protein
LSTQSRRWLLVAGALLAVCLTASGGLLFAAASLLAVNDATLVGMGDPDFTAFDCLVGGHFVQPGPAMKVNTEWVIDDDLVPVLAAFRRQGWMSTTHMTTNIQMLPVRPTAFSLGLLHVKVLRALALSYTEDGTTRVVATTRVVVCPP